MSGEQIEQQLNFAKKIINYELNSGVVFKTVTMQSKSTLLKSYYLLSHYLDVQSDLDSVYLRGTWILFRKSKIHRIEAV